MKYWTSNAGKLCQGICNRCPLCRLKKAKTVQQVMGPLPPERLLPSPPFTHVMLDLFGPYTIRGEVQKRISGKAWGVLFTDLCSRAVHIEIATGYDTPSFLLALNRFVSVRSWPSKIFSDPGTQLKGASTELATWWESISKDELKQEGAAHGLTWIFGPADSAWYQGAAESLIKSVKVALSLSVQARLSALELLTALQGIANTLNERPIGYLPGNDTAINILTPNSLLLGRSTAYNPGGYEPGTPTLFARLTLIQAVQDSFWKNWTMLYAPLLVKQAKWKTLQRDLQVGDVVLLMDSNILRGGYRLAKVHEVLPSKDGRVRKVKLMYKRYKVGEKYYEYTGSSDIYVERAVQRLVLVDPVV